MSKEQAGRVLFSTLFFSSGKEIMLDAEETFDFEDMLRMIKIEGTIGRQIATDGIKFTCPSCGHNRLECCHNGSYSSEVLNIDEDGDFDFGEISGEGEADRFQCLNCGYVLDDGYTITEHAEVVEWIKKNCKE